MNENRNKNKKEWIKNLIILFLIIMLILTMFSNTFRNYSLAEVTTANPTSGTIKEQARGTGSLESGDPYKVNAQESRVIESVAVVKGDHVEKGDILYRLEDKESAELIKAKDELDNLENDYLAAMFSEGVSNATITKTRTGNYDSVSTLQAKVNDIENRIKDAEALVNQYQNEIHVQSILHEFENRYLNTYDESIGKELINKDLQMELINQEMKAAEGEDYDSEQLYKLKKELLEATTDLNITEYLNNKEAGINKSEETNLSTLMANANAHLTDLNREKGELYADMAAQIKLEKYTDDIAKKKEEVEKLYEKSMGASIVAPVSGIISEMDKVAGESTEADKKVATILPDGKGYTLNISLDNKQASKVKTGDIGELNNAWNYPDVMLTVTGIKDDPDNSGKKKIVTFKVEGENLSIGQSMTVNVGAKSEVYDVIVPNSALRNDSNGDFVLILAEKKTPFGKRYVAERINVTKIASDDTNTAVSGGLANWDYIIITATKPLSSGDEFRLKEG